MNKNVSKILLSFLAGAAAGAALGILLAPDKGTNTRQKIKDKFEDIGDKIKDVYNKYRGKKEAPEDEIHLM